MPPQCMVNSLVCDLSSVESSLSSIDGWNDSSNSSDTQYTCPPPAKHVHRCARILILNFDYLCTGSNSKQVTQLFNLNVTPIAH